MVYQFDFEDKPKITGGCTREREREVLCVCEREREKDVCTDGNQSMCTSFFFARAVHLAQWLMWSLQKLITLTIFSVRLGLSVITWCVCVVCVWTRDEG